MCSQKVTNKPLHVCSEQDNFPMKDTSYKSPTGCFLTALISTRATPDNMMGHDVAHGPRVGQPCVRERG